MNLCVAIEQHFIKYQDKIYTDIAFSYPYWKEYLQIFDAVYPIARVKAVDQLPEGCQRADGDSVEFICIHDYLGFWDFLRTFPLVLYDCFRATKPRCCYLLRLGNISTFCWIWLMLRRKSYAFEAVGHAGESVLLVKNVQKFGMAKYIAKVNHWLARQQAKYACCASYTSHYVKNLYPPKDDRKSWIFSSVKLDDRIYTGPKIFDKKIPASLNIVSVGRIEPEKGHRILIEALIQLLKEGFDIRARIIGPGSEIGPLKIIIEKNGCSDNIALFGAVPWGEELFQYLDGADLFVLPSLTEGMPRALLEAMARGLPALGSDTGGIKELLNDNYRVPPNNSSKLFQCIKAVLLDSNRLSEMSVENYNKAQEYQLGLMNQRKYKFWECLLKSNNG